MIKLSKSFWSLLLFVGHGSASGKASSVDPEPRFGSPGYRRSDNGNHPAHAGDVFSIELGILSTTRSARLIVGGASGTRLNCTNGLAFPQRDSTQSRMAGIFAALISSPDRMLSPEVWAETASSKCCVATAISGMADLKHSHLTCASDSVSSIANGPLLHDENSPS